MSNLTSFYGLLIGLNVALGLLLTAAIPISLAFLLSFNILAIFSAVLIVYVPAGINAWLLIQHIESFKQLRSSRALHNKSAVRRYLAGLYLVAAGSCGAGVYTSSTLIMVPIIVISSLFALSEFLLSRSMSRY